MTKAKETNTNVQFARKKAVTLPVFKQSLEESVFLKLESAIYTGKKIKEDEDPAQIINVTDLTTGEQFQYLVPTVVQEILNEQYPDNGYVNRGFEIIKHAKQSGKRYHGHTIFEVNLEETAA